MPSIFPTVRVEIIKPLAVGPKSLPLMSVGVLGPMFRRYTEIKTNGYAVRPSTAESTDVTLDSPTNSQYIDYDSIEVDLAIAGSDEVVTLNREDTEVLAPQKIKQSNIYIESDTTGFYTTVGNESVFYPSTGRSTSYAAVPGDFLYLKKADVTISDKIKQVIPYQFTASNFPQPISYVNGTGIMTWDSSVTDNGYFNVFGSPGNITPARAYLILVNKYDKTLYKQYRITQITVGASAATSKIYIDTSSDVTAGNIQTESTDYTSLSSTLTEWNYYVYDMPLGGLVTYNDTVRTSTQYTTGLTYSYTIIDKNIALTKQGDTDGKFGVFVKTDTAEEIIFMPDDRIKASFGGALPGDYLRATNTSDDSMKDFRILSHTSPILKSSVNINNFTVKVASTADVTISNPGTSTIDGVSLTAGDRVLLKDQSSLDENGIYVFDTSSTAMVRATDFDALSASEIHDGAVVMPTEGTQANKTYSLLIDNVDYNFTEETNTTYEINIPISADTTFMDTKAFLVAKNVSDPNITRIFNIMEFYTTGGVQQLKVINTDFSSDGAGSNNAIIASDFEDWTWSIYRNPPQSLIVSSALGDYDIVVNDLESYEFSIVNKADFHVSGKNKITILNHISGSDGVEIGLADTIIKYNVLETEYASQIWDIVTETDRQLVCGDIANYNPMGLASGLCEINTGFSYKAIPCDIAFSERDPDNPKAYAGIYVPGQDNPNYHNVKNLDWVSAYGVLEDIKDTNIPYYIVPLSQDPSITGLSTSTITNLADPDKMKEMITFITTGLVTSETILTNVNILENDFEIVDGVLRYTPTTKWVSTLEPSVDIDFLQLGIKKGDYIVAKLSGSDVEVKFKVYNIYPTYLDLGNTSYTSTTDLVSDLEITERITIKHIYNNKTDMARALASKSSSIASFRVKMLWGDLCDITINGVEFNSVPSYFAAVAYAAMANNKGVVQPKTNWPINGITRIYNSNSFFGIADLEILGEGFLDVLAQDFDSGPIFSKRQFMTDGSELSGVEVVDELAKYIRLLYRPYLGKYNIDAQLYEVLNVVLASIITTYKNRKLNDLIVVQGLTVSGTNSDRISLKLRPVTKKPFNGLDVEIQVA